MKKRLLLLMVLIAGPVCAQTPTATIHFAWLLWNASSSTTVTGYNVYRATSASGPFVKINTSLVPQPTTSYVSYGDYFLQPNTTYYYCVTAVNSNARMTPQESACSIVASGITLANINPVTGLVIAKHG